MIPVAIYGTLETLLQAHHAMWCKIARDGVFLRAGSGNDQKSIAQMLPVEFSLNLKQLEKRFSCWLHGDIYQESSLGISR